MIVNSNSLKKDFKKGLYLVPTPIGNLADITLRAVEVLKNSDHILCEDTRVSRNLLEKYNIKSKLISYHKFNEKKSLFKIIQLLKKNLIISLISDAGTPTISDPGAILINECLKHNIDIIPLPGASAVSTAISSSGFSDKYFFYGFFPDNIKNLSQDLENLSKINSSIIFFVSGKKMNRIIPFLKKNFSQRKILICREISKIYEEFIRAEIDDLKLFSRVLKGEITIVISEKKNDKNLSQNLSESDKVLIKKMINKLSTKEIINLMQRNSKISKKEIYNYCLTIKNEK